MQQIKKRSLRPTPALVVAFVALFAAMGGFGYAAVKLKPASVKTKNIKASAVTTDKIADGAVTTPKLAPDAVAPNAVNAMNAARERGEARRRRPRRVPDGLAQCLSHDRHGAGERDHGPAAGRSPVSIAPARRTMR